MPKNKTGGKKHKKSANKNEEATRRPLELKQTGQEYAKVEKMAGDRRVLAIDQEGNKFCCRIPGALRRTRVNPGDYLLLAVRSYQDDKADIVYIYNAYEVNRLAKMGQIATEVSQNQNPEDEIIFTDESEEDFELVPQQPELPELSTEESDIALDDL